MRFMMLWMLLLLAGAAYGVAWCEDSSPGDAAPATVEPIPTIRQIMQQAHRCQNNYIYQVGRDLKQLEVDWSNLEQRSRDLIRMGKYLQQNTPPRGGGKEWERITGVYVAHATLLADAVDRHDLPTAQQHTQQLKQLCARCHRAHR